MKCQVCGLNELPEVTEVCDACSGLDDITTLRDERDQLKRDLAIALRRVADGPFMNRLALAEARNERFKKALTGLLYWDGHWRVAVHGDTKVDEVVGDLLDAEKS